MMKTCHGKQVIPYHHWNPSKTLISTHHQHLKQRLRLTLIHQYESKYHQFHHRLPHHSMGLNHQPHILQITRQKNVLINA